MSDDSPKRSRRDMVGQLVVILILMAILVGAIVFLHHYVTSHSSAPATSSSAQFVAHDARGVGVSADGHTSVNSDVRTGYR